MTWQPIATAPRDGTRVLLWCGTYATVGQFDDMAFRKRPLWLTEYWLSAEQDRKHQPTHWQALPPSPSEGEVQGG